jgi:hypothetical protein
VQNTAQLLRPRPEVSRLEQAGAGQGRGVGQHCGEAAGGRSSALGAGGLPQQRVTVSPLSDLIAGMRLADYRAGWSLALTVASWVPMRRQSQAAA